MATFITSLPPVVDLFSSPFLLPLPFSYLSSQNPTILVLVFLVFMQPASFFVSDIFGNLSSFILTMCPVHSIRLLTILPNMQALVPTSSLMSFILLLSTLFTPAILLIQLFSHTCRLRCCYSDISRDGLCS